ncbi:(R)-mandelonitrile lyase [Catellatospora vulcania]|uniref:(R)-mandelonitrile lyase n=1 Tax=Catellatospora vulcania TaxID=1460450 RepID=UPI0012D3D9C3|nr:cupin domain-containing protein [Catellatospora vulcania]
MELKPVAATVKTPAQNFTGDVYLTPIHSATAPSHLTVALVRFTPGARTNWHVHAVGQTLHVTEGVGLVGTRDGTVLRIRAGDTVVCPPGEEHWHGATADTFMSHLAMLETLPDGGDPTTWLEPVPEELHRSAGRPGAGAPTPADRRFSCRRGLPAAAVAGRRR